MAQQVTLVGAMVKVYINNQVYKVTQTISYVVDYGEQEIHGIDSPYAQEIAPGKVTVKGSVQGLRVKYSGGLQASNIRPLWLDMLASPYISIRIQDRSTGEDLIYIPQAKVTREAHSATTKSTYKLNFEFIGSVPYFALDRA